MEHHQPWPGSEDRRWTSIQICPQCNKHYTGYPALSRKDNATDICSACGTREALEEYVAPFLKQDIYVNLEAIR